MDSMAISEGRSNPVIASLKPLPTLVSNYPLYDSQNVLLNMPYNAKSNAPLKGRI